MSTWILGIKNFTRMNFLNRVSLNKSIKIFSKISSINLSLSFIVHLEIHLVDFLFSFSNLDLFFLLLELSERNFGKTKLQDTLLLSKFSFNKS